ncbi:MAG: hypothetical protein U0326_20570 [Polyangiales bacterium]
MAFKNRAALENHLKQGLQLSNQADVTDAIRVLLDALAEETKKRKELEATVAALRSGKAAG